MINETEVRKAYNITYRKEEFLHPVPRTPSENFLQDFEFSRTNLDIFSSEASRCEAVIFPLLREACKAFVTNYSLWSHKSIAATTDP